MISDIEFQRKFCVGRVDECLRKLSALADFSEHGKITDSLLELRSELNVPNTNVQRANQIEKKYSEVENIIRDALAKLLGNKASQI